MLLVVVFHALVTQTVASEVRKGKPGHRVEGNLSDTASHGFPLVLLISY